VGRLSSPRLVRHAYFYLCFHRSCAVCRHVWKKCVSITRDGLWSSSTLPEDAADMYEYTTHLRSRMAKAHAYVRKNMRSAVDRQRQAYYKD
jgi:hypothetical protein